MDGAMYSLHGIGNCVYSANTHVHILIYQFVGKGRRLHYRLGAGYWKRSKE